MTDSPNSATGRAIVRAIRGSLGLVRDPLGLLSVSQLLAVKDELREALAIVNGQIQAKQTGMFV